LAVSKKRGEGHQGAGRMFVGACKEQEKTVGGESERSLQPGANRRRARTAKWRKRFGGGEKGKGHNATGEDGKRFSSFPFNGTTTPLADTKREGGSNKREGTKKKKGGAGHALTPKQGKSHFSHTANQADR